MQHANHIPKFVMRRDYKPLVVSKREALKASCIFLQNLSLKAWWFNFKNEDIKTTINISFAIYSSQ